MRIPWVSGDRLLLLNEAEKRLPRGYEHSRLRPPFFS